MKYGAAQKEPELDDTGGCSHYIFVFMDIAVY